MKRLILIIIAAVSVAGALAGDELPLPAVPDSLRTPRQRAEFVMCHFWDAMDWRDTALTRNDRFMEQNAANFYNLFQLTDSLGASTAVGIMLDGASTDHVAYKRVADIARLYLYEPASPMADDEAFLVVADRLLADGLLDEADLLRLDDARQAAMLNRVGHEASDFEMIDRNGDSMKLSDALKKYDRTILLFYDPDCIECSALEHRLMESDLESTGVVMVSPYGEQDGLWATHAATMPREWIVARPVDDDFEDAGLYDIRSTPTVLIIDSKGRVISKKIASISAIQE